MIKGILTVLLVSTMVLHDDAFASELTKKESGSKAPQSADLPEQAPVIVLDGEHLTVTTSNDKLWAVLEEVSRRTGVKIVNLTGTNDAVISVDIQHVPIDEAIRRLVLGYDTFLFFESGDASARALKTLWVYSRGQGRISADMQEKALAAAETLTDELSDPNPEARAHAFEALLEKRSDKGQETVLQALEDTDEIVRHRTLSKALLKGVRLPAEELRDLVSADPSELVRTEALEMIINDSTFERADVRTIAEAATRDDSPMVQTKAVEIIDRLSTMERLGDGSELRNGAAVLDESGSDTSTLAIPEDFGTSEW